MRRLGAAFGVLDWRERTLRASRATRRAEERSVIRHTAFVPPRRLQQRWRQMADDGLRPLPPYASFIIGGLHGHEAGELAAKLRSGSDCRSCNGCLLWGGQPLGEGFAPFGRRGGSPPTRDGQAGGARLPQGMAVQGGRLPQGTAGQGGSPPRRDGRVGGCLPQHRGRSCRGAPPGRDGRAGAESGSERPRSIGGTRGGRVQSFLGGVADPVSAVSPSAG